MKNILFYGKNLNGLSGQPNTFVERSVIHLEFEGGDL